MAPNPSIAGTRTDRLRAEDFSLSAFARGEKHALALDVGAPECGPIPVLLAHGAKPGKTLVVTAGIHGDEYEGVRAIFDLHTELDPATLSGSVLAVPVANPPAFRNGTRSSPLDGANLARTFPGARNGSPSEVLAYWLGEAIIAHADFYIDLHSAGVLLSMPTMVGYAADDERARAAALVFGAPVVWAHPTLGPGRSLTAAATRGIPWLYTEARGAGRIDADDLAIYTRGVKNLLRHLGILPGKIDAPQPKRLLFGDGDLDASVSATRDGFFVPEVKLLDTVQSGQTIGRSIDLFGETVEVFAAPCAGAVAMLRAFPVLRAGEAVCLIAGIQE